ncbi:MAG: hypothetical protein A2Z02_00985 [Chloroflexi bacterium RBG_16_48_7]|nr:MAG: hypothetical protein A2Z02_00985 [Chloroflexi bacterium RBG_16_48_7]
MSAKVLNLLLLTIIGTIGVPLLLLGMTRGVPWAGKLMFVVEVTAGSMRSAVKSVLRAIHERTH